MKHPRAATRPRAESLAAIFLAHAPGAPRATASVESLEQALTAIVAAGRAAWPTVRIAPEDFVRHLAARVSETTALESVRTTDLYLACGCCLGDRAALAEFESKLMPGVSDFLARRQPGRALVDEVRQVLRKRLFVGDENAPPRICTYTGAGPLGGWLRVTAVRTAQNLSTRRRDVPLEDDPPLRSPDPEMLHLKRSFGREFREAFQETLSALPAKHRNVLALYYLEGMSSAAIGSLYDVHGLTVRRWLADARKTILDRTTGLLKRKLRLRSSELESHLALLESQLDASISMFLKK